MDFYIVLWSIVAACSFFDLTTMKRKKFFIIVISCFCTILGSLRNKVGTDWNLYYYFFVNAYTYDDFFSDVYNFEWGYKLLNFIVKFFSNEYAVFLLIFTGIICFFKARLIIKITDIPLVIFLLNFSYYIGDIFSVRQSLAIAIVVYSIIYIHNKNLFKFIITIIIASFFHRTAIIFLPAYWFYYRKFSVKFFIISILISLMIGASGIIEHIAMSFSGIDITLIEKMIMYTEGKDITYEKTGIIGIVFPILKKIVYTLLFILLMKSLSKKYSYYKGMFNIFFISNIIYCLFIFSIPEVAQRITIYYNFFEIFLIGMTINIVKNIKMRILIWILIVIYSFIYYCYAINRFYDLYVPYKSILG